jgi:methylenetetrahydrofolate dehydrogenase (NADP+)/methenyltetrahydrofolate cyclohydrolase
MSAHVIQGQKLAEAILDELKLKIEEKNLDQQIGLATILVGFDPASQVYVANKRKAARRVGIRSVHYDLPEHTTQEELLRLISILNTDPTIHGILVQLPLAQHIQTDKIIESLEPSKDVDGFHPLNLGYLLVGRPRVIACTPLGVMHLIRSTGYNLFGKHAVVVGRSTIVGKPLAHLLLQANATVTICHRFTTNLAEITKTADVLVVAVGKAKLITKDYIKPGAFVVDVGINKDEHNRLCGDVDFDDVSQVASYITPVPRGVGPLTIAMLLRNTWDNYLRSKT